MALAAGFVVAFVFHGRILDWLNRPLPERLEKPLTFSPAEPFLTSIKISLLAGFLLALPVILWQVWSFLAPAMQESSQRIVFAFVILATVLLVGGVLFAYFVALPNAIHFLTDFDKEHYQIELRARDYYSFATLVLFAVGIVFELPIFVVALVRLGVLTTAKLRRNRRIAVVVLTALAAALPGVDPVTMLFELIPLLILFELSIWISVFFERRRQTAAHPAVSGAEDL